MSTLAAGADRWRRAELGLAVALAGAGAALRVWVIQTPSLGYLDSDEAVVGLMARHLLHGQFSTFYWGQRYGGSGEVALVAAAFWVAGAGQLALELVPILLYAAAALLLWRIGRRLLGEPGAGVAALLFWVWPAYAVWHSTREYGYYGLLLVCGLAFILMVLRLAERPTLLDALVAGLALGVGWWCSVQIALVALGASAWLLWRRPAAFRFAPATLAAAVLGAAPWLVANVRSDFATLAVSPGAQLSGSYGSRLGGLVRAGIPTTLGLRAPFTLHWLGTPALGIALSLLVALTLLATLVRQRDALEPVVAILLPFPFLYALSGFTYYLLEPRYLGFLGALLALVVGSLARDVRAGAVVLAAALTLSAVALVQVRNAGGIPPDAPDVRTPTTISPLVAALERYGITRARANYWVAFRVTFTTGERIVVAPNQSPRYPPYNALVAASPRVAEIFVRGTRADAAGRRLLRERGDRVVRSGPYTVYIPPAP